jgi:hypothetical protein
MLARSVAEETEKIPDANFNEYSFNAIGIKLHLRLKPWLYACRLYEGLKIKLIFIRCAITCSADWHRTHMYSVRIRGAKKAQQLQF